MAKRIINGQTVDMTPVEEASFEASRTPTLAQARRDMRERIAARRIVSERGGFTYLGKRYDSSDRGTVALLANGARAGAAGFPVRVVAQDDSETGFNASEYLAFEAALIAHLMACNANARTLRQAVAAAADVAAVLAVDIEVGWP